MCARNRAAVNRRAVALGAVAVFSAASHAQADARPEDTARDVVIRFVKLRATPQMAWGYTRTELFADPAKPKTVTHILWSVYILEPRQERWRIVSLDWSIAKQK